MLVEGLVERVCRGRRDVLYGALERTGRIIFSHPLRTHPLHPTQIQISHCLQADSLPPPTTIKTQTAKRLTFFSRLSRFSQVEPRRFIHNILALLYTSSPRHVRLHTRLPSFSTPSLFLPPLLNPPLPTLHFPPRCEKQNALAKIVK